MVDSAVRASPTELALPRLVNQICRVCLDVHDFPGSIRLETGCIRVLTVQSE